MIGRIGRIGTILGLLFVVLGLRAHSATVEYAYDENGRLVGVVAPSGDLAQYVYDAAGNIVQINRIAAGSLALIEFSPKTGPAGTQVAIWGSGFSATPSQNTVAFNGATASVVSATTNKLIATVPSGATTGPISVTVGAAAATSTKQFVVTTSMACSARFTGFAPALGAPGSAVTISGNGIDSSAASAMFNSVFAPRQSGTGTTLLVNVPSTATSGRLSASLPPDCGGQLLGDFFVPPAGFAATDIGATGRLAINGPSATANLASGKKALYVFDGAAGTGVTLYLTGSTLGLTAVEIRAPDASVVRSFNFSGASSIPASGAVYLPMKGGFSVFINPPSAASGTITLQLAAPDLTISTPIVGTITANANGSFNIPVGFPQ